MATGYPQMTKALNATKRPIVFSCSWPAYLDPKVRTGVLKERMEKKRMKGWMDGRRKEEGKKKGRN
jgi:hypothetical protein